MKYLISCRLIFFISYFFFFIILVTNDFSYVVYDSEPDYLANALAVLQFGFPLNAHHPGTFSYYLLSVPLLIANYFDFDLGKTIYFIRFVVVILGSILMLFLKKTNFKILLFTFLLILLSPGSKMVLSVISAELLLLPISILIFQVIEKDKLSFITLGLIFALMLNIKLTSLILLPYILIRIYKEKVNNHHLIILQTFLAIIFGYLLLIIPVFESSIIPFLRIYAEIANLAKDILHLFGWSLTTLIFIAFSAFILFLITLIFLIKKGVLLRFISYEVYTICLLFLLSIVLVLYPLGLVFEDFRAISIASLDRHFLAAFPFIAAYIASRQIFKKRLMQRSVLSAVAIGLFFVLISNLNKFNQNYDEFQKPLISSNMTIYLLPVANFHSKIQFIKWAEYRYGKSLLDIPSNLKSSFDMYDNYEILNTRNIHFKNINTILTPSSKSTYISNYQECILNQIKKIVDKNGLIAAQVDNKYILKDAVKEIKNSYGIEFEYRNFHEIDKTQLLTIENISSFKNLNYDCLQDKKSP